MPPIISRGFRGRRLGDAPPGRVPPGQYVTRDFPVLSAGPTPHTPLERWDFTIVGQVNEPRRWTWEEFRALPAEEVTADIRLTATDQPGFWEVNGYHNYGDPWREQRYWGD
jgi:DMSO/TMAO reductase YedYZ molybdopterin-dependent catalytic subunit